MGSELTNMRMEDLDNILYEISRGNTRDMSTFRDVLRDWYGGIDIRAFQKLEGFIRSELGLNSDADLFFMDEEQKEQILEYLH